MIRWRTVEVFKSPTYSRKLVAIAAEVINDAAAKRPFSEHRKMVGRQKKSSFSSSGVQGDELGFIPPVIGQALPNGLKLDVQHGDAHQMRDQKGFDANGIV